MLTVVTVIHHQLTHAGHLLQGPTGQGRQLFQLTSQAYFSLSYLKEDQTALFSSLCFSKPKYSLHLAKELDTMLNQNPSSQALPPCLLLFKVWIFQTLFPQDGGLIISRHDSLALCQRAKEQASIRWYWWRNPELGVKEGKKTKEHITREGPGKAEQGTKYMNQESYEMSQAWGPGLLSVLYITEFVQNNMQTEYNSKIVIKEARRSYTLIWTIMIK